MTDLDERLRRDLASLADEMPARDIADASVRRGEQLKLRRRSIMATAGVAVVVAAIVIPISTVGSSPQKLNALAKAEPVAGSIKRPFKAHWFYVAAPEPTLTSGLYGPFKPPPNCTAADLNASARTKPVTNGIVGVIQLHGHDCAVSVTHRPLSLLDRSGRMLDVPTGNRRDPVNPGRTPYVPSSSHAIYGFSWRGSWCGADATSVIVPLQAGPVIVPLTGPSPPCTDTSHSVLATGQVTFYRRLSVAPSPPEWSALTVDLAVAPRTAGITLRHLVVTIHNASAQPVHLDPQPTYFLEVEDTNGEQGGVDLANPLPVSAGTRIVPAHGHVTIRLPDLVYPYSLRPAFLRHPKVTVSFSVAGIPTATATTHVGR